MFSILHISDLHRSVADPISNDELISALVSDRDRYIKEEVSITAPQAIIVSGDIIQGVSLNTSDFENILVEQYAVAEDFLDKLCRRFLNGDRSKVIIVPGNHDIDWNTARAAMTAVVDPKTLKDITKNLFSRNSKFRWDWSDRSLFQITDPDLYEKRLAPFRNFFARFYNGVDGLFKVLPNSDVSIFLLDEGRIAVAAFNSCDQNDCFSTQGAIRTYP